MNTNTKPAVSIDTIPIATWEILAKKKIFFGHQSVGNNIIDGVEDLMKTHTGIKLHILRTEDPSGFSSGGFAHYSIGQNEKPETKIQDFERIMDQGIGSQADIAFFKFCYVDITAKTDIQKLFNEYKHTMDVIKNKYPKTTFLHCTVPLMTNPKSSIKSLIKKLLGRVSGIHNNVARNEFNELLRNEYSGKAMIIDIAEMESTYLDGTKESLMQDNKTYYSLIPDYTDDGGHLNELGRKQVAEEFLKLLVKAMEK